MASADDQRSLYEQRAAAILAMDDLDAAFAEATLLRGELGELESDAAELRAVIARRMWETGRYSIAQLAARLGVKKTRADQLLRRAGQPPP